MAISINNSSVLALAAGSSFVGHFDDLTTLSEILISLSASVDCTVQACYSLDKTGSSEYIDTYLYHASSPVQFYTLQPKQRYFKLRVVPVDAQASPIFRLQTVYKPSHGQVTVTNQFALDSTSVQTNTLLTSISGRLDGSLSTTIAADSVGLAKDATLSTLTTLLQSLVVNTNQLSVFQSAKLNVSTILANGTFSAGDVVGMLYPLQYYTKFLTFYGTCDTPTILTLEYSNDGGTWFTTNHTLSLTGGDFNLEMTACAPQMRWKTSEAIVALVMYYTLI